MDIKGQIDEQSIAKYNEYLKPMKQIRKKQERGMIIFFLVCIVIGAFIGVGAGILDDKGTFSLEAIKPFELPKGMGILYYVAFVFYIIVTMPLHTIIHEVGHLVFGLLTGYRFLSFRIFSFTIVMKGGKIAIKKLKVPGTMGQCLMYPPEWKEDKPYPYTLYNLGGGLLNLISCVLVTPLFFTGSPLWIWIAGLFVFFGLIFAITNVVPMTLGIPNDGKNCLDCKRSKEARRALYLQLKINADMSDGAELIDFPIETFQVQEPEGKKISALIAYLHLQEYYWYLAKGREEDAKAVLTSLEQKREKMITAYVNTIDLERLYFMALQKAPIEEIAAYYTVLRPALLQNTDLSVLRVKYVYYLLLSEEERENVEWLAFSKKGKLPKKLPKQKKPITAEKIYEDMLEGAKKHPVAGEAKLYMQLTEAIKERDKNDN
ncbi:MAG: hypothetical protein IJX63_07545 [Lachnospiraceae bacterium]|nr:hypothetical protein [Lachnospiraceae bacterium]